MNKAFTMIELIFVIVIIGIIAAIAIPKLNATRDDALISTIIENTQIVLGNAQSFYTSQGNIKWQEAKIMQVTDVPLYTDTTCTSPVTSTVEATPNTFYLCDKAGSGAINVVTFKTIDEGNLTIVSKGGNLIADTVSTNTAMVAMANNANIGKTYILGGVAVNRD